MLMRARMMRIFASVMLGLAVAACGSVHSRGADGGDAGAAGRGGTDGGGGTSIGGTGGGMAGNAGAPGAGTGGVSMGEQGGVGGGSGAAGHTTGGSGGSSQCPVGQVWCPGCTPGTGSCSPGVCAGFACPPADAGSSDASGACALATTVDECDARAGCHSVFVDPGNCRCAALGCCAHFSRCADAAQALCKDNGLLCTMAQPHCEGPYVIGFASGCYEGCVRMTACAP